MTESTHNTAHGYASLGWRVLPIRPGTKRPTLGRWQERASTDASYIDREFSPGAGIGIATGEGSGVWVLDIDGPAGQATLSQWEQQHGRLPEVPTAQTGTGGLHFYFECPPGFDPVTNSQIAGSGVDVRGTGGQALLPPTIHATRDCKLCDDLDVECPQLDYSWIRDPWEHRPVRAPRWLEALVVRPDVEQPPKPQQPTLPPAAPSQPSAAAEIQAAHDWHSLLSGDGWTLTGHSGQDTQWARPGKTRGVSAILHEPEGPLVVYSTNAPWQLQRSDAEISGGGWSYSLFGYLAATRHDGDRSQLAREWRRQETDRQWAQWRSTVGGVQPDPPEPPDEEEEDADFGWARVLDWGRFWADEREPETWAIRPLLPAGRGVALYAPAKAGKSTVALAAVLAAVQGRPTFGQWEQQPSRILYLDYEMSVDDLWERLTDMGVDETSDLSRLFYAQLPSLPPLDTEQGGVALLRLAQHYSVDACVIDTYGRAVVGEEDSADTTRAFYRHTGQLLKAHGFGWLRTDHAGKEAQRGQRGSSGKNDDVDVVWQLAKADSAGGEYPPGAEEENPNTPYRRLRPTHTRISWVPSSVHLVWDTQDGRRVLLERENPANPTARDPYARQRGQLLEAIGVPRDATYRAARSLLDSSNVALEEGEARMSGEEYRRAQEWRRWHS